MITVGYSNRTRYWQIYTFENPPEGVEYKRALDIPFHLTRTGNQFLLNTKWMLPFQNCNLFHTYNSIATGNKPWIVEVESLIPRYGTMEEGDFLYEWGIKRLKSRSCKAIIFTSEYTRNMNQENFRRWGIDQDKCHVVYRAVKTHTPVEREGEDKKFTILFVGNGFYRKGGLELLRAFKKIKKRDVRLVLISSFEIDWQIYPSQEEINFVEKEIRENKKIQVFSQLPHSEVIEWMRKSDIFVSTTYADPFNNTILEALACGVPAITSDVRATPEFIMDGYNGFMIDVEKHTQEEIVDFISEKIEMYYDAPDLKEKHGRNALEMIKSRFTLEQRNPSLSQIYKSAIDES